MGRICTEAAERTKTRRLQPLVSIRPRPVPATVESADVRPQILDRTSGPTSYCPRLQEPQPDGPRTNVQSEDDANRLCQPPLHPLNFNQDPVPPSEQKPLKIGNPEEEVTLKEVRREMLENVGSVSPVSETYHPHDHAEIDECSEDRAGFDGNKKAIRKGV